MSNPRTGGNRRGERNAHVNGRKREGFLTPLLLLEVSFLLFDLDHGAYSRTILRAPNPETGCQISLSWLQLTDSLCRLLH